MAGSGYLRSTVLRDIKDAQDSLKRMIRELKKGRRRLRSEINAAIRKLEECKRMRDELNELSSAISYTHTETTQPEVNKNESFFSPEEDLMKRQNENIDLMDNDENTVLLKSGKAISTCINSSNMSIESLQFSVGSFPSIKRSPSMESFTSMESGDSSNESFDSTVESTDSSVESTNSSVETIHSSLDNTDFSEDEFLDSDDDFYDIFAHSSTHWCVEGSALGDTQKPISTISTAGENSQSFEREKTNCKKEDVISVFTNEYKKRILSIPVNIKFFENIQDRNKINITNAALTTDNYERLEREEIEDLKRKISKTSSLSSNSNFSNDSSKITIWSLVDPFKNNFREAVTEKNSNCQKKEEFNDKEENYLGINSYPETNFSKDPFMSFLPKPIIIPGFTNNRSEKAEREECSFRKKCFSGASTNSKMHFSEDFPKDEKWCKNNETNIGKNLESSIGKDLYNEEFVSDSEVDSNINLYFSENLLKHEKPCLNKETMMYDDLKFPKMEELVNMNKNFNSSSTSLNWNFSDDSFQDLSWCMNIGTITTENLKPVKKDQFAVMKVELLEKEDKFDSEKDAFDCSSINLYPEINCYENLQDEIINKLVKVGNENCKFTQREKMNLKKEGFNDLWINHFDKKNSSEDHQKQINEIAMQMLTEKFSHPEENFEHSDNEDEGMVSSHYLSSFKSLIDKSKNCPRNMESSENIRNSLENKFDIYYNKNREFPDFSFNSQSATFPANTYDDTKLHEINIAVLNNFLHPVEREVKDFGIKIKIQDENEINSLSEISWKNICEKAETMKQFSDFSTDGLNHTAESAPHFGDKNTMTGSLDTDTLSGVISDSPSHEDVSIHLNAVKRPTEDSVPLEIKNTKPFACSNEKLAPTNINHVNNILNNAKAE